MKKIIALLLAFLMIFSLVGCTTTTPGAPEDISKEELDDLKTLRRFTIINSKDEVLLELTGACSMNIDIIDSRIKLTCKTGKDQYKIHYIKMKWNTTYMIEDIGIASLSSYKYELDNKANVSVKIVEVG